MRKPRPWTVVRSEPVADCRVFEVTALHCRREETESDHTFFRIDAGDWVNVIPMTEDGKIIMVRQFRHGAAATTLEIPGGMVDAGEDPGEAAGRELLEETGYEAASLERLGAVNPNPALFPNRLHSFVARGCRKVAAIQNDTSEETVVELVARDDVPALMKRGAIDHALVIVAFHWLALASP